MQISRERQLGWGAEKLRHCAGVEARCRMPWQPEGRHIESDHNIQAIVQEHVLVSGPPLRIVHGPRSTLEARVGLLTRSAIPEATPAFVTLGRIP